MCMHSQPCLPVSYRVVDQHKLTREQWEERIVTWYGEHKSMLRYVRKCLLECAVIVNVPSVNLVLWCCSHYGYSQCSALHSHVLYTCPYTLNAHTTNLTFSVVW